MIAALTHFHFLRPEWLLLAPTLFIFEWLLQRFYAADREQNDPFKGIVASELLRHLRVKAHRHRWFTPSNALRGLLILAVLITAGPSWRQQISPLAEDAVPLVILLDTSDSMNTKDVQPSRLVRAKQKMTDLLALVPDKRTALIVYAGSAHTILPLTNDHDILANYMASVRSNMMPRSGKFAEYALRSVDIALADTRQAASVLLVTDGLGSDSAIQIESWFNNRPHELIIYAIGSEDPLQSNAPLARRQLKALANQVNGILIDDTVDAQDMAAVARALNDAYIIVDDQALPWEDGGYLLVFPALLLSLLWFRRGWTQAWGWLLVPLFLTGSPNVDAQRAADPGLLHSTAAEPSADISGPPLWRQMSDGFVGLWLTPDQHGRILLQLGAYERAAGVFEDPIWQATARYYAEQFNQAALLFTRRDSDAALFNEANARAHRRDYVRAIARYNTLLSRNQDFPGAAENRDFVQALVDEMNALSESQSQEDGMGSSELDPDNDERPADGAEELSWEKRVLEQYSAEDILNSPEVAEMWLRGVQQDPANFLNNKFSTQLQERGVSEP